MRRSSPASRPSPSGVASGQPCPRLRDSARPRTGTTGAPGRHHPTNPRRTPLTRPHSFRDADPRSPGRRREAQIVVWNVKRSPGGRDCLPVLICAVPRRAERAPSGQYAWGGEATGPHGDGRSTRNHPLRRRRGPTARSAVRNASGVLGADHRRQVHRPRQLARPPPDRRARDALGREACSAEVPLSAIADVVVARLGERR